MLSSRISVFFEWSQKCHGICEKILLQMKTIRRRKSIPILIEALKITCIEEFEKSSWLKKKVTQRLYVSSQQLLLSFEFAHFQVLEAPVFQRNADNHCSICKKRRWLPFFFYEIPAFARFPPNSPLSKKNFSPNFDPDTYKRRPFEEVMIGLVGFIIDDFLVDIFVYHKNWNSPFYPNIFYSEEFILN